MANGFNLGGLSSYSNQTGEILYKAIAPQTLIDSVKVMTDVKMPRAINLLDMDLHLQSTSCALTATGATYFTQRTLTPCKITHYDKFCMTDLEGYWTAEKLSPGSTYMDLDYFKNDIMDLLHKKIGLGVQKLGWMGNTDTGSGYLSLCDGWIKTLSGDTTHQSTGGTTITASNIVSVINAMILKTPEALAGTEINIYLSHTLYNMFVQGWAAAYGSGPYFIDNTQKSHPFYANYLFKPQSGLEGYSYIVMTYKDNLVFGTDINDEWSMTDIERGVGADKYIHITTSWKQGVQIAFPDQVIANF